MKNKKLDLTDYLLNSTINSPPQYFYIVHPFYPQGIVPSIQLFF